MISDHRSAEGSKQAAMNNDSSRLADRGYQIT